MMNPLFPADQITHADPADAAVLACLIAEAFHELAPSRWLVPDVAARHEIYPRYFQMYVEDAFAHGEVHTTADLSAVALWIHNTGAAHAPDPEYDIRLDALTGVFAPRFKIFDRELDDHHPMSTPHHHLAILAVHPKHQRVGMGTALLDYHHERLDEISTMAYLEASDAHTRKLYLRHGYTDHGYPIVLPDGPKMYPMIREALSR